MAILRWPYFWLVPVKTSKDPVLILLVDDSPLIFEDFVQLSLPTHSEYITPKKFNIDTKNGHFERSHHFQTIMLGICVSFRGCTFTIDLDVFIKAIFFTDSTIKKLSNHLKQI